MTPLLQQNTVTLLGGAPVGAGGGNGTDVESNGTEATINGDFETCEFARFMLHPDAQLQPFGPDGAGIPPQFVPLIPAAAMPFFQPILTSDCGSSVQTEPDVAVLQDTGSGDVDEGLTADASFGLSPILSLLTPLRIAENLANFATGVAAQSSPAPLPIAPPSTSLPAQILPTFAPEQLTATLFPTVAAAEFPPDTEISTANQIELPADPIKVLHQILAEPVKSVAPDTDLTSANETAFRLRVGGNAVNGAPSAAHTAPSGVTKSQSQLEGMSAKSFAQNDEFAGLEPTDDQPIAPLLFNSITDFSPAIGTVALLKPIDGAVVQANALVPTAARTLPASVSRDLVALTKTPTIGPTEILLNPQELGQLRFEIHHKGDQLRVVLCVERPETMDLLRRNADQLLGEFRTAGFSGASLSFGQWDQQGGDPRAGYAPQPPPKDPEFDPPAGPKLRPAPPELAALTGLNIRL